MADSFKNFHTHTTRCKHAFDSDEAYVQTAIENGYTTLGFTDHAPWPYTSGFQPKVRMEIEELGDYLASIRALRERYRDRIEILIGLECEYFPQYMDWLKKTARDEKLDYIILGNHFDQTDDGGFYFGRSKQPSDVDRYVDLTIEGLETGVFSCLAHPELPLRYYAAFDQAVKESLRRLCVAAKRLRVPLEYNLLGLHYQKAEPGAGLGYPYQPFWEMAAEVGCEAVIGVDAHRANHLAETEMFREAKRNLDALGIHCASSLRPFGR